MRRGGDEKKMKLEMLKEVAGQDLWSTGKHCRTEDAAVRSVRRQGGREDALDPYVENICR